MAATCVAGFRVTGRDVEIVRWVGRQRFAEARQVAQRFQMDERNAYRRAAYVRARQITAVRYYAAPAARSGVERAVGRAGAHDLFDIQTLKERDDVSRTDRRAAA